MNLSPRPDKLNNSSDSFGEQLSQRSRLPALSSRNSHSRHGTPNQKISNSTENFFSPLLRKQERRIQKIHESQQIFLQSTTKSRSGKQKNNQSDERKKDHSEEEEEEKQKQQLQPSKGVLLQKRIDKIYGQIRNRLRIDSIDKQKQFNKKLKEFNNLKTFINLQQIIEGMNILTNKHLMSTMEVLQIRDKMKELDQQMQKASNYGELDKKLYIDNEKVNTMLDIISRHYQNQKFAEKMNINSDHLTQYLGQEVASRRNELVDPEHDLDDFFHALEDLLRNREYQMMKRQKLIIFKISEEESKRDNELRALIKKMRFDYRVRAKNNKRPQQTYYERFHQLSNRLINDASKISKQIFNKHVLNQKESSDVEDRNQRNLFRRTKNKHTTMLNPLLNKPNRSTHADPHSTTTRGRKDSNSSNKSKDQLQNTQQPSTSSVKASIITNKSQFQQEEKLQSKIRIEEKNEIIAPNPLTQLRKGHNNLQLPELNLSKVNSIYSKRQSKFLRQNTAFLEIGKAKTAKNSPEIRDELPQIIENNLQESEQIKPPSSFRSKRERNQPEEDILHGQTMTASVGDTGTNFQPNQDNKLETSNQFFLTAGGKSDSETALTMTVTKPSIFKQNQQQQQQQLSRQLSPRVKAEENSVSFQTPPPQVRNSEQIQRKGNVLSIPLSFTLKKKFGSKSPNIFRSVTLDPHSQPSSSRFDSISKAKYKLENILQQRINEMRNEHRLKRQNYNNIEKQRKENKQVVDQQNKVIKKFIVSMKHEEKTYQKEKKTYINQLHNIKEDFNMALTKVFSYQKVNGIHISKEEKPNQDLINYYIEQRAKKKRRELAAKFLMAKKEHWEKDEM